MGRNDGLIRPIRYDRGERQEHRSPAEAAANNDAIRAARERGELTDEEESE